MNSVVLGLRANWRQFALLVIINGFVGAMVGLERAVLPVIAQSEFGVSSTLGATAFILTFGLAKAAANLVAGTLADRKTRRPILLVGWLLAFPVPVMILAAPNWAWIVVANALLGAQQGLAWSATVIMKIDLVGPRRRGLAMGLNEFAGYVALGLTTVGAGLLAAEFGGRITLGYAGLVIAALGLTLSLFTTETAAHANVEGSSVRASARSLRTVVRQSLWSDASLFSLSQAGLVNNLNDGLAWGVFPLLFVSEGRSLAETGLMTALYPLTWGITQLATGALSDRVGRKPLIVGGQCLQGVSLILIAVTAHLGARVVGLIGLGVGTALVYPTLLAAVGDVAHPAWRGTALGVYRMWRDLGFVAGALIAGSVTDSFGAPTATFAIGVLTVVSGLGIAARLPESQTATPIARASQAAESV